MSTIRFSKFFGSILTLGMFGLLAPNLAAAQNYQVHPIICQGCMTADDLVWKANEQISVLGLDGTSLLMVVASDEPITAFFTVENGEYIPYTCEAPGFCFGGYYTRYAVPYKPLDTIYSEDNRIFSRKVDPVEVPPEIVTSVGGVTPSNDAASTYLLARFQILPDTSPWGLVLALFGQGRFTFRDNENPLKVSIVSVGDIIKVRFSDGSSVEMRFMGINLGIAGFVEVPGSRRDASGNRLEGPPSAGGGSSYGEVQTIEAGNYVFGVANNIVNVTTCTPMEFTLQVRNADGTSAGTLHWRSCV